MRPRNIALLGGVVAIAMVVNIALTVSLARHVFAPPAGNNGGAFLAVGRPPMVIGPQLIAPVPQEMVAAGEAPNVPINAVDLQQVRGPVVNANAYEISGPFTHANLSVFLIHGPDTMKDQRIITLQEAVNQNLAVVHDGGFNLTIDNRSNLPLFIQGGDIVKGGNQDRVLPYDILVPANAGRVSVSAFCVEAGRSFPRGDESSSSFQVASEQLPTRSLKLAALQKRSQAEVWAGISQTQANLSRNIGGTVQASQSQTSLQLTLEHPRVQQATQEYLANLLPAAAEKDNVIGYAVVVNGKIQSADVYASADLFRNLWPKLLKASSVEALADLQPRATFVTPTTDAVQSFLAAPERGQAFRQASPGRMQLVRQESAQNVLFETCDSSQGNLVLHRCYLAK